MEMWRSIWCDNHRSTLLEKLVLLPLSSWFSVLQTVSELVQKGWVGKRDELRRVLQSLVRKYACINAEKLLENLPQRLCIVYSTYTTLWAFCINFWPASVIPIFTEARRKAGIFPTHGHGWIHRHRHRINVMRWYEGYRKLPTGLWILGPTSKFMAVNVLSLLIIVSKLVTVQKITNATYSAPKFDSGGLDSALHTPAHKDFREKYFQGFKKEDKVGLD